MIDDANALLRNEFDKYLAVYKTKNREFFQGYKAARVIYDKGGSRQTGNGAEQAAVKTQAQAG